MFELKPPTGENTVLSAYSAIRDNKRLDAEEMVARYHDLFDAPPPVSVSARPLFERFSLVDPTIYTVIQSTTASY